MKHLSPTDAVPVLRGDVIFSDRPKGTGAEVIDIRPIGFGHGTRLHGFELSLARMLDGRRTAQDLVNRATRIGLPLSLLGLEGFIAQLERHQLLARTAGEAASAVSPWAERVEWDPGVRQQYQAALKALRAGRGQEARVMLDQLLATAPALDEARALRRWLDEHPNSLAAGEPFERTFAEAERGWLSEAGALEVTRVPTSDAPLEADELHAVRPSVTPMLVLIALVIVGLVTLLIPIPAVVSVPAQLSPAAVAPVQAPADGTIGAVQVHEGDWVEAGRALITYGTPARAAVTAPAAGTVRDLTATSGASVLRGQHLLDLEDTRHLRVSARLDPIQARDVRPGQSATIALGNRHARTTINAVSGRELITTVDNSNNVMEPGRAVIDIDVGWRSLLQRMLRR